MVYDMINQKNNGLITVIDKDHNHDLPGAEYVYETS